MIKLRYILLVGIVFFVLGCVAIYRYSQSQTLGQNSSVNTLSPWKVVSGTITPRTDTNDLAVPTLVSCDTIDTDTNGVFSCGTDDGGAGGSWSTTTADYWATTDLKLQELSDVQDPNAWGQLLMWTGSAWATTSTSSLGVASALSGGSAGALTYWTSGTAVSATTSPTVGYITATSTTASKIPYASSTAISATTFIGALTVNGDYITDLTGSGLTLSGSSLTLNATGDWTGTIDGNNFAGGAIGSGDMLYGSGAGSIAELALGASSTVLTNNGTAPRWMAPSGLCVAITGSADLCDGSDDGAGGSSEWTDAGSYVYPNEGDYAAAPYFVGTSTATSTFAGPAVFGGRTLQVGNPTEQAYVPSGGLNSAFLILDKPNAASDASVLLGSAGDLKWEIGMAGDENLYWKKITGTEASGYTFESLFKMDYSTARVGIGTDAPSSKLEIASMSPSARVDVRVTNKSTSGTDGSSLQLVAENDGHVFYVGTDAGLNGSQNAFLNWGSFGTGLFMDASGNVAVQTTTIPTGAEFAVGGDVDVTGTTTTDKLHVTTAFNFLGDVITNTATWFLSKLQAVTSFVAATASTWDFTNATVKQQHYTTFTWPGTATTTTATTTVTLGPAGTSQQWNWADCKVTSGTGALQFKDDSGNKMDYKTLSTSYASTTLSTNNTFTGHEGRNVDVGPITSAVVTCTVQYKDS